MNPIRSRFFALVTSTALLLPVTPVLAQHAGHDSAAAPGAPASAAETAAALRDLWIGHVFWVRNVAVAAVAGDGEAVTVAEKEVVANARAIAAAIELFYGKEASGQLFDLLAGHYGAVKKSLDATLAAKGARPEALVEPLKSNATEIAKFLSAANPNLPFDTLNGLLIAHGVHHLQQIDELYAHRYAEEARTWEAMKNHMYVIADALAAAIAKQFPQKFR